MELPPFLLDHWLAAHEFSDPPIRYNLASSTGPRWTLHDLRRTAASQAPVAMVGHEPNLSELASLLLVKAPGRLVVELKKGGAMCLTFEGEAEPGGAALRWLLTQNVLRALRS